MGVLQNGYKLPFLELPPIISSPLCSRIPTSGRFREELDREVEKLLAKRAIEEVLDRSPGFYSHIFLVPKKSSPGEFRLVINLTSLNKFLRIQHFKMETPQSIRLALRPGFWACSIDLKDAYLHVPIHTSHRRYLRFVWKNKVFQFRALCFGLATAPRLFTKLMTPVSEFLHRQGIKFNIYLDDSLIRHRDPRSLALQAWQVVSLFERLGLVVNYQKSDLTPKQNFTFIGVSYKLNRGLASHHRIVGRRSSFG